LNSFLDTASALSILIPPGSGIGMLLFVSSASFTNLDFGASALLSVFAVSAGASVFAFGP
jgi:hypothetical protein